MHKRLGVKTHHPQNPLKMQATTLCVIFLFITFVGTSVGEGTFGKVKLGKHILTGEKVRIG